jgi:hypothetical protein
LDKAGWQRAFTNTETHEMKLASKPKGEHMKSRIRVALLSSMLALFVGASLPAWANDRPPMKNGPVLTAKEAQTLVATARTAKEHLKLARYFNQQALQFDAEAKEHDEMIEAYRKNPTPGASKTTGGARTIEHCEFLANSAREMAKAFREMAAAHEQIANEAAK